MLDKRLFDYIALWLLGVTTALLPLQPSVVGVVALHNLMGLETGVILAVLALAWHLLILIHPNVRLSIFSVLTTLALIVTFLGHTFLLSQSIATPLFWSWFFFLLMAPAVAAFFSLFPFKSMVLIISLAGLQAQWAVLQFAIQSDLGMYLLGESLLSASTPGVAKFLLSGEKVIRAYGPFSHPNALAGVLVIALLLIRTMLTSGPKSGLKSSPSRIWWLVIAAWMLLAVTLSFSRGGWMAVGIVFLLSLLSGGRQFFSSMFSRRLGLLISICLLLMLPLVWWRVTDAESVALQERLAGVSHAVDIIADQPWLGVGLGVYPQALGEWSIQSDVRLDPWQVTYVHNVPLLMMAELGLLGLALLAVILLFVLRSKNGWLFVPLLPLLIVDHFLYTYPVMWFWLLVLGLVAQSESGKT